MLFAAVAIRCYPGRGGTTCNLAIYIELSFMSLNLAIEEKTQHVIFGWTFDTYNNLAAGIPTTGNAEWAPYSFLH
jgi:hypothetical protein